MRSPTRAEPAAAARGPDPGTPADAGPARADVGARWSEWMRAAQAGDRRLYARLLEELVPFLERVVRRRWPRAQPDAVADVVQETLKSVHVHRQTYDPSRPFLPWLLAIAHHRLADEIRRRRRTAAREVAIHAVDETFLGAAANTDQGTRADGETLRAAIAELPPAQRTAVELLKMQGMSLKEASAASGSTVSALKVAVHRALATLKAKLGGSG